MSPSLCVLFLKKLPLPRVLELSPFMTLPCFDQGPLEYNIMESKSTKVQSYKFPVAGLSASRSKPWFQERPGWPVVPLTPLGLVGTLSPKELLHGVALGVRDHHGTGQTRLAETGAKATW